MWPGPYGEWGSRKYLLDSLDQSLTRMRLDHVDIFYSHRFDPDTPLEETMGALDTAVRQGKARYAGISLVQPRAHPRGGRAAARAGHPAADPPAVLLDAQPLDRGGAARRPRRRAGRAASPSRRWRRGLLTDRYLDGVPDDSRAAQDKSLDEQHLSDENLAHIRALNEVASGRGQSLAQLALAWALRDARVTSVLIGASSVRQLEQNVAALERLELSADELAEIDRHAVESGINLWAASSQE